MQLPLLLTMSESSRSPCEICSKFSDDDDHVVRGHLPRYLEDDGPCTGLPTRAHITFLDINIDLDGFICCISFFIDLSERFFNNINLM